ncbi:Glycosyl transferase, group 1 family protein [Pseudomonas cannabina pv. alisalensis]|uniref:Glycosyl transferase, group 1 protein n=2 Tax=Pseudomonas syringae group TaxID=136849 RepID=A0A3M3S0L3_PSECA|nr:MULTISPECIES: glycosyltransferase family 1 protein [Pseudomonas syringae group]KPW19104.1 Glycosyl transferase, group 1 family protein [Pseudomonas cannabina pv. alisalensis]QHE97710.1 glycosyltransferase [Pseudomonas syringae pv. maculicola str. ES4326]RMN84019.1 Glycosyl transferase, group 1 protein [Pseudomonas cannabina]RMN89025.1 Glycosyl transferase, group 1 protein [Pseudomonas cannabina pv. alisalensis]RMO02241.1 Glycosyl transferase, group 1 protein [Pseudomonas cannabina]
MIFINSRFLTQDVSGVQRYAEQMCRALRRLRNDLVFVAPHRIRLHDAAKALDAQCIGRNSGHLWEQLDLPLYLKNRGSPLLISISNTGPMLYGNQIATHHDINYVRYPQSYTRLFRLAYRIITPMLLSRARTLMTGSRFSRSEICAFYNFAQDKVLVTPAAVSEDFTPRAAPSAEPRYLLAVSSPAVHKNFKRLIQAFLSLRDHTDLQLHIVGAATSLFADPDLQRLACRDPRIRFLGRLSDSELIEQYQGATAFIFPSLYEGFGIPPLEAQACGCPVLAANVASIPEVLQASALYFDPLDVGHMAAAMQRVLIDAPLRQALRLRGLDNVQRFSWDLSAQQLSQRIDLLLQPAPILQSQRELP